METFDLSQFLHSAIPALLSGCKTLCIALVILFVGLWLIGKLCAAMAKIMEKRNVDLTLRSFTSSVVGIALKVLLVISVVSYLGIPMTSFVAILGAAGLAVGMALQGTLQNFAGGVMLLLFRPFKVGDFVELKGYSGVVKEVQIFNTILTTGDNKVVIIPNGGISTDSLTNYSKMPERRVDLTFGIGYDDDIDKAYAALRTVCQGCDKILAQPEPFMAVANLADSAVEIALRVWVKSEDYWTVVFYLNEAVKKQFDKEGISFPFPQRDVHVTK